MNATSIPVLCYHRIDDEHGVPAETFGRQLDAILALGFRAIGASELVDIVAGKSPMRGRPIVITFDDGFLDNWTTAAPMLAARGMTGVFFVTADLIGDGHREAQPSPLPSAEAFSAALLKGDRSQFMNREELSSLVRDMGMEILPHSARHQPCFRSLKPLDAAHWGAAVVRGAREPGGKAAVPPQAFPIGSAYAYNGYWPTGGGEAEPAYRLRSDEERFAFCLEDFARSREAVDSIAGGRSDIFCWPWGEFDGLSTRALKEAGFRAAFTLERGPNAPGSDPFHLCRLSVGNGKTVDWLARKLRIYGARLTARLMAKHFHKKPEVKSVLYVSHSRKISGGARQMVNNALAMAEYGLAVHLVCAPESGLAGELAGTGITVHEFDKVGSIAATARYLSAFCRANGVDVLHTFHNKSLKAAVTAKLLGGRFRLFLNRGVIFNPNTIMALLALVADGVTCNSLACMQVLRRHLVPASRLNVIYNSFLGRTPAASSPLAPPLAVYVGNDSGFKGLDVFLKAAVTYLADPANPPAEFAVCGSAYRDGLLALGIGPYRDKIRFLGTLRHDEVLGFLSRASVYVLTSRQESMPNTLIEAFNAGLPVVCTAVGGVPDIVRNGVNGCLCPSEDAAGLAGAIAALLRDPEKRAAMGRENRRLVTTFFTNARKGLSLLALYSGARVVESLPFTEPGGPQGDLPSGTGSI